MNKHDYNLTYIWGTECFSKKQAKKMSNFEALCFFNLLSKFCSFFKALYSCLNLAGCVTLSWEHVIM